ncbi:lipopolysaccharide transport system permease protein [Catalinimonas alkaloidigena]|uniref:ABC transporter permease n=1 Tax=Catalinimonas alkaloidigena TaxID=1075417 RepID=UPI002405CA82|nr:ABC transporter permease [Catalinimonas alkaloidigena]MDF9798366.1 lipopolysaccharide transport system permease protein [Catalinimonas alkaloidigena]
MHKEEQWDTVIKPKASLLDFQLGEVWRYRDLLSMFVRRDVVTVYKQTVLGPIWYIVQPIMMTAIYVLVFGRIAKISTDGLPQILFYLSGIVLWNYFSETFTLTSKTFKENESIFGKVYFPRIIMPISKIVSGLIKFGIQFGFFLIVYLYFIIQGYDIMPTAYLVYLPALILLMAGLSLGCGIIFTSLTSKYRDLNFLIQFGVQLLMYATPVIYPVSTIPEKYKFLITANPMTPIIEGFRYALLGAGSFNLAQLGYSLIFTLVLLIAGIIIFNKTEKTFMDTV